MVEETKINIQIVLIVIEHFDEFSTNFITKEQRLCSEKDFQNSKKGTDRSGPIHFLKVMKSMHRH